MCLNTLISDLRSLNIGIEVINTSYYYVATKFNHDVSSPSSRFPLHQNLDLIAYNTSLSVAIIAKLKPRLKSFEYRVTILDLVASSINMKAI